MNFSNLSCALEYRNYYLRLFMKKIFDKYFDNQYFSNIFAYKDKRKIFSRINNDKLMIGAITGDIIGSVYEFNNIKTKDFPLFSKDSTYTDDTIMTIAVADWLLHGGDLAKVMQHYGRKYPNPMGGYGGRFSMWLHEKNPKPYNSWGNGAAMRVSPVGWYFDTLEKTMEVAKETAMATHNHEEGIKGAQAVAAAIFLARKSYWPDDFADYDDDRKKRERIKKFIEETFGYDLNRTCDEIRPTYGFDESCQGTVPEAIIAFLESKDYEDAVRLAVSLGGDSDTLACITGGIAQAYYLYKFPLDIWKKVYSLLDKDLQNIYMEFHRARFEWFVHPRWWEPHDVRLIEGSKEEKERLERT